VFITHPAITAVMGSTSLTLFDTHPERYVGSRPRARGEFW
jgi:hypothetical protein